MRSQGTRTPCSKPLVSLIVATRCRNLKFAIPGSVPPSSGFYLFHGPERSIGSRFFTLNEDLGLLLPCLCGVSAGCRDALKDFTAMLTLVVVIFFGVCAAFVGRHFAVVFAVIDVLFDGLFENVHKICRTAGSDLPDPELHPLSSIHPSSSSSSSSFFFAFSLLLSQ